MNSRLLHQTLDETRSMLIELAHSQPIDPPKPMNSTVLTGEFWKTNEFYKDGDPKDIVQVVEGMLGLKPSERQKEILYDIAGRDPYEWDLSYQQYVLAIGQGGGKNKYLISPIILYYTYRIANMKDPWAYFSHFLTTSIDRTTPFEISNSSMVNDLQAKNVHFKNMKTLIRRFKDKDGKNWLIKYTGMDLRHGVGDVKRARITIPTLPGCGPIILHSFGSTDSGVEGLNLIAGIVDEASRANTQATYADVKALCSVIRGNINSRFPRNVGKLIVFSYLNNSEFDYTETMLQEAEENNKIGVTNLIYTVRLASWDTNPNISKDDPSVQADYRNDPSAAKARYECIKGNPKEGFYQPHPEKVQECFVDMVCPVEYRFIKKGRDVRDPGSRKMERKNFSAIDITNIKGDNRVRGWALDPAEKYDSFILKGGYVETMDEMKDDLFIDNECEMIVINKRPIIDIVFAWQPQARLPVDFVNVGEVLGLVLAYFPNSRFVNSDKWNSAKLSQEVMARGVSSTTYGFGSAQQLRLYMKLRWLFWNNVPMIAYHKEHVLTRRGVQKTVGEWNVEEHAHLLRINNKIDHPANGGKDLADVDAILCNDLIALETAPVVGVSNTTSPLTDPKIAPLINKYLVERQRLRNSGIRDSEQFNLIAVAMKMPKAECQKIKDYVDGAGY